MSLPPAPVDNTTRTAFKTPDITPAQITAAVGAILGLLAAFGLDVSAPTRDAIAQLAVILPSVIVAADALIRHGRSKVAAAQIYAATDAAQLVAPPAPAPTTRRAK